MYVPNNPIVYSAGVQGVGIAYAKSRFLVSTNPSDIAKLIQAGVAFGIALDELFAPGSYTFGDLSSMSQLVAGVIEKSFEVSADPASYSKVAAGVATLFTALNAASIAPPPSDSGPWVVVPGGLYQPTIAPTTPNNTANVKYARGIIDPASSAQACAASSFGTIDSTDPTQYTVACEARSHGVVQSGASDCEAMAQGVVHSTVASPTTTSVAAANGSVGNGAQSSVAICGGQTENDFGVGGTVDGFAHGGGLAAGSTGCVVLTGSVGNVCGTENTVIGTSTCSDPSSSQCFAASFGTVTGYNSVALAGGTATTVGDFSAAGSFGNPQPNPTSANGGSSIGMGWVDIATDPPSTTANGQAGVALSGGTVDLDATAAMALGPYALAEQQATHALANGFFDTQGDVCFQRGIVYFSSTEGAAVGESTVLTSGTDSPTELAFPSDGVYQIIASAESSDPIADEQAFWPAVAVGLKVVGGIANLLYQTGTGVAVQSSGVDAATWTLVASTSGDDNKLHWTFTDGTSQAIIVCSLMGDIAKQPH